MSSEVKEGWFSYILPSGEWDRVYWQLSPTHLRFYYEDSHVKDSKTICSIQRSTGMFTVTLCPDQQFGRDGVFILTWGGHADRTNNGNDKHGFYVFSSTPEEMADFLDELCGVDDFDKRLITRDVKFIDDKRTDKSIKPDNFILRSQIQAYVSTASRMGTQKRLDWDSLAMKEAAEGLGLLVFSGICWYGREDEKGAFKYRYATFRDWAVELYPDSNHTLEREITNLIHLVGCNLFNLGSYTCKKGGKFELNTEYPRPSTPLPNEVLKRLPTYLDPGMVLTVFEVQPTQGKRVNHYFVISSSTPVQLHRWERAFKECVRFVPTPPQSPRVPNEMERVTTMELNRSDEIMHVIHAQTEKDHLEDRLIDEIDYIIATENYTHAKQSIEQLKPDTKDNSAAAGLAAANAASAVPPPLPPPSTSVSASAAPFQLGLHAPPHLTDIDGVPPPPPISPGRFRHQSVSTFSTDSDIAPPPPPPPREHPAAVLSPAGGGNVPPPLFFDEDDVSRGSISAPPPPPPPDGTGLETELTEPSEDNDDSMMVPPTPTPRTAAPRGSVLPTSAFQHDYIQGSLTTNTKGGNLLKSTVSKKKRRFKMGSYDLDLTYITDRIIAMGFPSVGTEAVYRNDIRDVTRFFENRHPNHYKIYNLCSERLYPKSSFPRVLHFPFDDHNPPCFQDLTFIVRDLTRWLRAHPDNVAGIHCKAGKGRTGLIICILMLYIGMFIDVRNSLRYYATVRTQNAKGVTIPSQIRYVYMFQTYMIMAQKKIDQERTLLVQAQTPQAQSAPNQLMGRSSSHLNTSFISKGPALSLNSNSLRSEPARSPQAAVNPMTGLPDPIQETVIPAEAHNDPELLAAYQLLKNSEEELFMARAKVEEIRVQQKITHEELPTQLPLARFLQIKSVTIRGENAPSFDFFTIFNRGKTVNTKDIKPKMIHEKGLPVDKSKDKKQPEPQVLTNFDDDDDDDAFTKSKNLYKNRTYPGDGHADVLPVMPGPVVTYEFSDGQLPVFADFYLEFHKSSLLGKKRIFAFWLHTQFVEMGGFHVSMTKEFLDKINKTNAKDFQCEIVLEPCPDQYIPLK